MTEVEICSKFRKYLENFGFITYPEYYGYDFCALRDNIWVGFQAKRKLTIELISQATVSIPKVDFKAVIYEKYPKKHYWHFLNICGRLKIIPIQILDDGQPFIEYFNQSIKTSNPFYGFYLRPKTKLPVQEGLFSIPAGAKAPLRLTERNIALCKLEKIALGRIDGCVSIQDAWDVGLIKLPHYYYKYDLDKNCWTIRDNRRASLDYPHVWEGIK